MLYLWDSFLEPIGIFLLVSVICFPILFFLLRRNKHRNSGNDIFWYTIAPLIGIIAAFSYMQYQKLYRSAIDGYEQMSQLARDHQEIPSSATQTAGIMVLGETGEYGTLVNPFLMLYVPAQCRTKIYGSPRYIIKVFNKNHGKKTPRDCHGAMCGASGSSENPEVMLIFDMKIGKYIDSETAQSSNSPIVHENATIQSFSQVVAWLCKP